MIWLTSWWITSVSVYLGRLIQQAVDGKRVSKYMIDALRSQSYSFLCMPRTLNLYVQCRDPSGRVTDYYIALVIPHPGPPSPAPCLAVPENSVFCPIKDGAGVWGQLKKRYSYGPLPVFPYKSMRHRCVTVSWHAQVWAVAVVLWRGSLPTMNSRYLILSYIVLGVVNHRLLVVWRNVWQNALCPH
jgi:hypothetical protein